MSGKSASLETKKSETVNFTKTKKHLRCMTQMLIKYKFLKKNHMVQISQISNFFGIIHDDVIRPLSIKLPQMIGYVKCFENNKTMSFKISE